MLSKARIFSLGLANLIWRFFPTLSASNTCKGLPKSWVMKFVISTNALIGLNPRLISFFCNHSGDTVFFTSLKYLLITYSQLLLSFSIFQLIGLSKSNFVIFSYFRGFNFPIPLAERSLATPLTPRQSPLLGVMPISKTGSFNFSASIADVPFSKLSESSIIPSWSSLKLSSLSDKSIPSEISPRILPFFRYICVPGIYIPSLANIPFSPFLTLFAPHITW